jgi:hypothetical protein
VCCAQVMYYFLGKMLVLQPDTQHTFVKGEPDHPMLAPGPGLYTLREPSLLSTVASGAHAKATKLGSEGAAQAAKVSTLLLCWLSENCTQVSSRFVSRDVLWVHPQR